MADVEKSEIAKRPAVAEKSAMAGREEETLAFWEREHIFEKSLTKPAPKGDFVFYEGPPTANGMPGIHHLESRAFKDAIPRYKTMRGYRVERRAGWDTHGLPVELEVEKQLGFSGKKEIEKYGVAAFNQKCRESVLTYIHQWEKFTSRIGYWVDQSTAYFTFNAPYMEAVWGILATAAKADRVYKDYKVVPWCPRDGTSLSSHELALGYEDVKDITVTAKFKIKNPEKIGLSGNVFLLAWTTTPWTLPGNIALAVGENIAYGLYDANGEQLIVATTRATAAGITGEPQKKFAGKELIGLEYEPLYPYAEALAPESEKGKFDKAFKVYAADFVTTEDGTGIVHTAVMYGQEDFELGNKIGLPKVHLVNPEGKYVAGTGVWEGKSVVEESTTIEILKDLSARELLFSKAPYTHSYPFCWRCHTRLIYYARDSWYIRMQDLREKMVAANNKVHWVPDYIREGRMGEWLTNAKDWAISRERYWGTPLPIWRNDAGEQIVIGSVEELKKHTKKSGNTYFVMRHGEGEHSIAHELDSTDTKKWRLTEKGRAEAAAAGAQLKQNKITKIYASPFERTKETAEIVADELGIPRSAIIYDDRLREFNFGELDGKDALKEFLEMRARISLADPILGGESYLDAKRRFGAFLYELESQQTNETILIVSHGIAYESLATVVVGADAERSKQMLNSELAMFAPAEVRSLDFVPLPHNGDYELDLHKPFIDDVVLLSATGKELRRVSEVMDVWFDSGGMPFAQDPRHVIYPADFISEAIDQTRGWFYTLLAIGTLMGKGESPYKNVICLGHLLDANGQKMSKSKGNVVEPFAEIEKRGADTLRYWMYYVNQPGDSKNYDEKTVKEVARVLAWFENSTKFYELFSAHGGPASGGKKDSKQQIIDQWMRVRTEETVSMVTSALESYDLYSASRELARLGEDLSQWYVRRVRDRAREGDAAALETLRSTLETASLLLAPLAPFLAEWMFAITKNAEAPESVHLAPWPAQEQDVTDRVLGFSKPSDDQRLVSDMKQVREIASQALQLRQKANIKVRQPLAKLEIIWDQSHADSSEGESVNPGLLDILKEELNVKEVVVGTTMAFDTALTPELIKEGDERELARAVAEARKSEGCEARDKVRVEKGEGGKYTVELSTGPMRFDIVRDVSRGDSKDAA